MRACRDSERQGAPNESRSRPPLKLSLSHGSVMMQSSTHNSMERVYATLRIPTHTHTNLRKLKRTKCLVRFCNSNLEVRAFGGLRQEDYLKSSRPVWGTNRERRGKEIDLEIPFDVLVHDWSRPITFRLFIVVAREQEQGACDRKNLPISRSVSVTIEWEVIVTKITKG